jgi:hypothetical protein
MTPPPEVISRTTEDGEKLKRCELPDGRWINVLYDDKNEIRKIVISFDTTPSEGKDGKFHDFSEVRYTNKKAWYDVDSSNSVFEGAITTGYDFEKLKALAERIFGKWMAEE